MTSENERSEFSVNASGERAADRSEAAERSNGNAVRATRPASSEGARNEVTEPSAKPSGRGREASHGGGRRD